MAGRASPSLPCPGPTRPLLTLLFALSSRQTLLPPLSLCQGTMASATILSQPVLVQPRPTPVGSLKTLPGGGPPPNALSATPQPGPARAEPKKPAVECQHLAGLLASSSGDRVLERYRQVVKWAVRERLSAGKGKERANVSFATCYVASLVDS